MDQETAKFEEWAIVDLFGHQRLAGKVSEATLAGGAFVRIDIPDAKGRTKLTKYLNPKAIYDIVPCDENVAVAAAQSVDSAPIARYQLEQLATTRALPYESEDDE